MHDATIFTRRGDRTDPVTVIAAWLPGESPVAPEAGLGFAWRAGEQLVVRIHYKKNWKLENKPATDRSTVGLYLTKTPASRTIRGLALEPGQSVAVDEHLQGVAVRAADSPSDVEVRLDAIRPDGSRIPVAGFLARAGWDQRYWLARPIDLPKGTRLEVKTTGERLPHLWLDSAPAAF